MIENKIRENKEPPPFKITLAREKQINKFVDLFPQKYESLGSVKITSIWDGDEDDGLEIIEFGTDGDDRTGMAICKKGKYNLGKRVEVIKSTILGYKSFGIDTGTIVRYFVRPLDPRLVGKQWKENRDFAYNSRGADFSGFDENEEE